jgi:hypothetical protein
MVGTENPPFSLPDSSNPHVHVFPSLLDFEPTPYRNLPAAVPDPAYTASIAQELTDTLWRDIAIAPQACLQTLCRGLRACLKMVAFIAAVHSLGPHRVLLAKHHSILGGIRKAAGKS